MSANVRADKEVRKEGRRVHRLFRQIGSGSGGQQDTCPNGRQFPPVVRPRFRGFRFPAVDCSAFAVVGEFVSPPFRFSCAFCIEGVDDPAGADAFGLGAFVCCGVPFALSGDNDGEDADGAPCGIVAGVI
jgi:hypothetical protein